MIIKIILALVSALALGALILSLYPKKYLNIYKIVSSPGRSFSLEMAVFIFALIGWVALIYSGTYTLLWFIPAEWGSIDEDGEWLAFRVTIAIALTLWIGSIIFQKLVESYRDAWGRERINKDK